VELLVVVSIITVLIALLLPALGRVRRQAQMIACAANLRSIGQALTMYAQQYAHYPCGYIADTTSQYALWPVRLRPFTSGNQDVFHCPAQEDECRWQTIAPEPGAPARATEEIAAFGYELGEPLLFREGTRFSYGYNCLGAGSWDYSPNEGHLGLGEALMLHPKPFMQARELPASRVRKPAEMVAIVDTQADGMFDFTATCIAARPTDRPAGIHNGGCNVLFCDGHVQWYRLPEILVTYGTYVKSENNTRRLWNNDNRPHSGDGQYE
jgi:prepilin-type processing-associated H-X9-DG protein